MSVIPIRTQSTQISGGTVSSVDSSSTHEAHISHFGVLKAGPTIPVFMANFPGSELQDIQWTSIPINSASITVSDGMGRLDCGTNSAGSITVRSKEKGLFKAGQVTVFQSGVRAGLGLANNVRKWGMESKDAQEGLYFRWNGTAFQVVSKKSGIETTVDSGSFNGEPGWSPSDANTTYRIEYSAGRAIFYRASGGKKVMLHQMVNTQEPLVNNLNLPLCYENTNTGNTTNISMYVRGGKRKYLGGI